MKYVYLRNASNVWQVYSYTSDVNEIINAIPRNITVGSGCNLVDYCYLDNSCVLGNNINIAEGVFIGVGAVVGNGCDISAKCYIAGSITIGANVSISNECVFGPGCVIDANTSIDKSLFINGSQHPVTYVGNGKISIGCLTDTIANLKSNYASLGETYGYSAAQITEYHQYILLAESFYNNL